MINNDSDSLIVNEDDLEECQRVFGVYLYQAIQLYVTTTSEPIFSVPEQIVDSNQFGAPTDKTNLVPIRVSKPGCNLKFGSLTTNTFVNPRRGLNWNIKDGRKPAGE